ncbi:aldolase [Trametes coccinea BRFM310]|uniref:Aldolase n=1 Tax=Trametes coccinea (strain BRFM310) TaxID=1353009 RepID=A0A1Y2IH35_TRAC3|nr:aldolase [Trametes coccinea BRFM310]
MSERSSTPSTEFVPPQPPTTTTTTPAMPVTNLRGKRRSNAHEQNGSSPSKIPVASPPPAASTPSATKSVATAARANGEPKGHLRGGKGLRPANKSSIPFPTSSAPAPPVLTAAHASFANIAFRFLSAPRAPKEELTCSSMGLGKRPRPSTTRGKPKTDGQKPVIAQATPPLWRTLEAKRKGVIAATLDYELLGTLPYAGTMVTPGMLREGLLTPDTAYHAWVGAKRAIEERYGRKHNGEWHLGVILKAALQHYLVELGTSMLDRVDGPHYTFIDPRLHDSPSAMVKDALKLAKLFAEKGYGRDRIVFTIPATEEGVQAAQTLERKYNVQTNLTLVSGLHHAAACAGADATCITLCYKELSDACGRKSTPSNPFVKAWEAVLTPPKLLAEDAIRTTAEYLKRHSVQSAILVADLQSADDAENLGNFDAVAFTAEQSLRARARVLVPESGVTPRSGPKAVGTSRKQPAEEDAHPILHLSRNSGAFLSAMPVDARTVAKVTLASGLEDMSEQMFKTSMHVLEFIQGEAQLAHIFDDLTLQEFYEEDEKELVRLAKLEAAGQKAEPRCPIRTHHVGFRLRHSSWSVPSTTDCIGRQESREQVGQN